MLYIYKQYNKKLFIYIIFFFNWNSNINRGLSIKALLLIKVTFIDKGRISIKVTFR